MNESVRVALGLPEGDFGLPSLIQAVGDPGCVDRPWNNPGAACAISWAFSNLAQREGPDVLDCCMEVGKLLPLSLVYTVTFSAFLCLWVRVSTAWAGRVRIAWVGFPWWLALSGR